MYKKELGRFTGADPLLSSGRPTAPQTWNRYAYVLNNPLVLIDPNGLYECEGTSGECAAFRQNLADARAKISAIVEKYGEGSKEHIEAEKALGSYGCESKGGSCINADGKYVDTNGKVVDKKDAAKDTGSNVKVSFDWNRTTPAHTSTDVTSGIVKVQFTGGNHSNFGLVANEGINLADMKDALNTGTSVSLYQSERDGLFVQAVFGELRATGNNANSAFFNNSGNPVNYWEKGWETPDHQTVRANRNKAIDTVLKETYKLTPQTQTPLVTFPKGYKPKK